MRPSPQHRAQATTAHSVARIVAALTLVVALLSVSAPPGALAFAVPEAACSMSCCVGKPAHAAGDCASVSCHVELPGRVAPNEAHDDDGGATHDEAHHAAAPPLQNAGDNTHDNAHEAHARPASHGSHSVRAETHPASHAPQTNASLATKTDATDDATETETEAAGASQTDTADATQTEAGRPGSGNGRRRRVAAHSSVANPCPPDCGTAAGGFGNNVRPRDAAALTRARRPRRPPARPAALAHFSNLPRASSDRRRLTPPRAPPAATPSAITNSI